MNFHTVCNQIENMAVSYGNPIAKPAAKVFAFATFASLSANWLLPAIQIRHFCHSKKITAILASTTALFLAIYRMLNKENKEEIRTNDQINTEKWSKEEVEKIKPLAEQAAINKIEHVQHAKKLLEKLERITRNLQEKNFPFTNKSSLSALNDIVGVLKIYTNTRSLDEVYKAKISEDTEQPGTIRDVFSNMLNTKNYHRPLASACNDLKAARETLNPSIANEISQEDFLEAESVIEEIRGLGLVSAILSSEDLVLDEVKKVRDRIKVRESAGVLGEKLKQISSKLKGKKFLFLCAPRFHSDAILLINNMALALKLYAEKGDLYQKFNSQPTEGSPAQWITVLETFLTVPGIIIEGKERDDEGFNFDSLHADLQNHDLDNHFTEPGVTVLAKDDYNELKSIVEEVVKLIKSTPFNSL